VAALPDEGWTRLSAGEGAEGTRCDDWLWLALADPVEPEWRWLLVRRCTTDPRDVDDAAEGVLLAVQRYGSLPVTLGIGYEISIKELVETITALS